MLIENISENNIIKFLLSTYKLKEIKRRGWILKGITDPESISDHTFGTSLFVLILSFYSNQKFNLEKALIFAIIHDLGESIIGDITPHDGVSNDIKYCKESEAIKQLSSLINNDILFTYWEEYSKGISKESMIAKEADLLDMLIQAIIYKKTKNIDINGFIHTIKNKIFTKFGKKLLKTIEKEFL